MRIDSVSPRSVSGFEGRPMTHNVTRKRASAGTTCAERSE
jgi:hypothetical protein